MLYIFYINETYCCHVLFHATPSLVTNSYATVHPFIIFGTCLWVGKCVLSNLEKEEYKNLRMAALHYIITIVLITIIINGDFFFYYYYWQYVGGRQPLNWQQDWWFSEAEGQSVTCLVSNITW